jgi:hypothetical protein
MTKEYRVFEVDEHGNRWFEISFSGIPEYMKIKAENYVKEHEEGSGWKYVIEEVI